MITKFLFRTWLHIDRTMMNLFLRIVKAEGKFELKRLEVRKFRATHTIDFLLDRLPIQTKIKICNLIFSPLGRVLKKNMLPFYGGVCNRCGTPIKRTILWVEPIAGGDLVSDDYYLCKGAGGSSCWVCKTPFSVIQVWKNGVCQQEHESKIRVREMNHQ